MSAWKKPSRSVWRRKDWTRLAAIALRSWPAARSAVDIGHLDAVDPLQGQHVAAGALPVDRRHAEAGIVRGVLAEFGKRGSLQPQVHLDLGGLGERLRHLDRAQPARRGDVALLQPRGEEIAFEVAQEERGARPAGSP